MSTVTICIVENETGYDCAHVSIGTKGAFIRTWPEKARGWDEEPVTPNYAEDFANNAVRPLSNREACLLALPEIVNDRNFSRLGLPVDNARWREVFHSLRKILLGLKPGEVYQLGQVPPIPPSRRQVSPSGGQDAPKPGKIIPLTRLRKFYATLRTVLAARDFHELLCSDQSRMAKCLARLFCEASNAFAGYENIIQNFCPKNAKLSENANLRLRARRTLGFIQDNSQFAKCLKARVIQDCIDCDINRPMLTYSVVEHPELNFNFVDFEISPYRTTGNAKFSDKSEGTGNGQGGLDLLLCTTNDAVPVVGEIKAERDTNIFLALVQSLVYASELATTNQIARLQRCYSKQFSNRQTPAKCDIYLIYENTGKAPALLDHTLDIVRSLLQSKRCVRQHIRRIAFISAKLSEKRGVEFHCNPGHIIS